METALLVFGVYMTGAGILMVFNPEAARKLSAGWIKGGRVNRLLAVVPLAFGYLLLWAAPASELPIYVKMLGWITVLKGMHFLIAPAKQITGMMDWWLKLPQGAYIIWGYVAVAMGLPILLAL